MSVRRRTFRARDVPDPGSPWRHNAIHSLANWVLLAALAEDIEVVVIATPATARDLLDELADRGSGDAVVMHAAYPAAGGLWRVLLRRVPSQAGSRR